MSLPHGVRAGVERALIEHGFQGRIRTTVPVTGGCINNGVRIDLDAGGPVFVKWNPSAPAGIFEAEADGLKAMSSASSLRVPQVLSWGEGPDGTAWLVMEYVGSGRSDAGSERALGMGLAEMHAQEVEGAFGWWRDNWIGSLEQHNAGSDHWGDFWRDRRIEPQLSLARRNGAARDRDFDALLDVIPNALADIERAQLVHGDLWGGNWFTSERGEPVLIDPAVYRGHGEVDLAMSELFGGFAQAFYDAYDEVLGIPPAYSAYRKDLYQLYYLLVHVNLFGDAYVARSLRAARRVLSALR